MGFFSKTCGVAGGSLQPMGGQRERPLEYCDP